MFSLVAVVNTTIVHSGYHLPWVYPSPEHHDYHHEKFNVNYGVTGGKRKEGGRGGERRVCEFGGEGQVCEREYDHTYMYGYVYFMYIY